MNPAGFRHLLSKATLNGDCYRTGRLKSVHPSHICHIADDDQGQIASGVLPASETPVACRPRMWNLTSRAGVKTIANTRLGARKRRNSRIDPEADHKPLVIQICQAVNKWPSRSTLNQVQ